MRHRAGRAAFMSGNMDAARSELERAHELFQSVGATREAALVLALLGNAHWQLHEPRRALELLEGAYAVLASGPRDEAFAPVAAELGRTQFFLGDLDAARATIEAALDVAERLWLPETLSQALNTAGLIRSFSGGWEEGYALIKRALEIALENDLSSAALRAYNNLGDMLDRRDRYEEALDFLRPAVALARKVGERGNEWRLLGEMASMLERLGRRDESEAVLAEIPEEGRPFGSAYALPILFAITDGDAAEARRLHEELPIGRGEDADEQDRLGYLVLEAMIANAEGRHEAALEAAITTTEHRLSSVAQIGWEQALVAAHHLGRDDVLRQLVDRIDQLPPGHQPPTLRAHALRYRAHLGDEPDQRFRSSAAVFREYGVAVSAAQVQTEHSEWLAAQGRLDEAEALLAEARPVFERVRAQGWLERVDAVRPGLARIAAGAD